MEFKDRIRGLREEKGISYTEIGAMFGKTESATRAWELGRSKPDADTLIKLAEHFECTSDFLLGLSDYKNETAQKKEGAIMADLSDMIYGIEAPARGFILTALEIIAQGYRNNKDDAVFLSKYMSGIETVSNSLATLAAINYVLHKKLPWPKNLRGTPMTESDLVMSVDACSSDIADRCEELVEIIESKYPESVKELIEGRKFAINLKFEDFL